MVSDEVLMLAFQRGSREALEELFARYREPLYGFFRRRLPAGERSQDVAQDLAQETFLALMRAAARYEPRASVRTYFYAIALNLLVADRRRQARNTLSIASHEPANRPQTDAVLWLRQALDKLDETEREIVMLREYEQLSYSEIADLLQIPVNTVRSRLFRTRLALKALLEPRVVSRQEA
jgi:RNA polymerase sigma-70 factor (ECF subfamily)